MADLELPEGERARGRDALEAWRLSVASAAAQGAVLCFSIASFLVTLGTQTAVGPLVSSNEAPAQLRGVGGLVLLAALALGAFGGAWVALADERGSHLLWLRRLRPLMLLFLVPGLADHEAFRAHPQLSMLVLVAASLLLAVWTLPPTFRSRERADGPAFRAALWVLIAAWAAYVSFHTIRQHRFLETRAYDMGVAMNMHWHAAQGRVFYSSLDRRNHLGVHTHFVHLPLVPLYALFPRAETLLVAQALALALSAWPLYLIGLRLLGDAGASLLVVALYLAHPALGGAAFYDFHELAFAPLPFLFAIHHLLSSRVGSGTRAAIPFWTWTVVLLSVKEDMSIVVASLGVLALLQGQSARALKLIAAGAVAYLVLQRGVIQHFAGGEQSFAWYYSEMIPKGEGPSGLVRTALVNPLFTLRVATSPPKLLFLLQLLGPFLLLPLAGVRGLTLAAYPLAACLLASREPVYQMGFQYALLVLPAACVGFLLELSRRREAGWPAFLTRPRVLLAAALVSTALEWHAGMLTSRSGFRGGFRVVDFDGDSTSEARYAEVRELAALIPPGASVTASETLVPHVAHRWHLQTSRLADVFGRDHEYWFLLRQELADERIRYPEVFNGTRYDLVREGRFAVLYRRRPSR